MIPKKIEVVVDDIIEVNSLIKRFEFTPVNGNLPVFSGGSHVVVEMDDNGMTRRNPYSLMSDPGDNSRYAVSVRRDDEGRGGSLFMHNNVSKGDKLSISYPTNLFKLDLRAKKHLMIAGGIGITPFISQMYQLDGMQEGKFELHYSVRNKELGAYADELKERYPHNVHIYVDDQQEAINLEELLANQPVGTHVYTCGPKGMIEWVLSTAQKLGWPEDRVHYEEFLAPAEGAPFTAELTESNISIEVGEHQSLLEAIEAAGLTPPYLCRGGACGQCETEVVACDGEIIHNDHWLDDEQKASNKLIMPCVSRCSGGKITIKR